MVVSTLCFSSLAANYRKDFFCGFGITLIGWFTSLVTVLIIAVFISLIGQSLSWYNHFYVSVCLYGTAAAAKIIFIHTLAKRFYYVVSVKRIYFFLLSSRIEDKLSGIHCTVMCHLAMGCILEKVIR